MFITSPATEHWAPPGIFEPGSRCWSSMHLPLFGSWFIVTYATEEGLLETAVLAWEATLRKLVEEQASDRIRQLLAMVFRSGADPGWAAERVTELWAPAESEIEQAGPLIFGFADRSGLFDSHQRAAPPKKSRRRLLLRLPST